jgi:hypothetical protein
MTLAISVYNGLTTVSLDAPVDDKKRILKILNSLKPKHHKRLAELIDDALTSRNVLLSTLFE